MGLQFWSRLQGMMYHRFLWMSAVLVLLGGCPDSEVEQEEEDACTTDSDCEAGLSCFKGLCVGSDVVIDGGGGSQPQVDAGEVVSPPTTTDAGSEQPPVESTDAGEGSQAEALVCDSNGECVYEDPIATLVWQGCPAGLSGADCSTGTIATLTYEEAVTFCDDLSWSGHSDWLLPRIEELRSLIRGCAATELGDDSTCAINHACSYSTGGENTCGAGGYCVGCTVDQGPADGRYWPAALPWAVGEAVANGQVYPVKEYWSLSLFYDQMAYEIDYGAAYVNYRGFPFVHLVRCVRY